MPIVAADLIAYNALSRPEDDTSTGGGGIDIDNRPAFTPLAANDDLEVLSSAAGDTTQVVTVDGRDATGAFVTATATLNGTTAVILSPATTFERVLSVLLNADAVGTVTLRRSIAGATVYAIPIGERGASAFFIAAASQSGAVTRYDKMFWRNAHGSLTLTTAQVQLTADPAAVIRQGVAATKGDTATIANRVTAPSGITFVDDSVQQAVPTNNLASTENIGVWIEQALAADNAAIRSTFTTELAGNTVA
ncbi:MAG: hypothetical protein ACE5HT_01630 [Gemmatimonadales bacterium]